MNRLKDFSNNKYFAVIKIILLLFFLCIIEISIFADDVIEQVRPKEVVIIDYILNSSMKYEFTYDETNKIISIKRILFDHEDSTQQYIYINYIDDIIQNIYFNFTNSSVLISRDSSSAAHLNYISKYLHALGESSERDVFETSGYFGLIDERFARSIDSIQFDKTYSIFADGKEIYEVFQLYPECSRRHTEKSTELYLEGNLYGYLIEEVNEYKTDILIQKIADSILVDDFRLFINYENGDSNYKLVVY